MLGPLAPGSLSGNPCEFCPQKIPVSVRSALLAPWSCPPLVLYGQPPNQGTGSLSGAAQNTGPGAVICKRDTDCEFCLLCLNLPCFIVLRSGVCSVLFLVSPWVWFSSLGGWEVREGTSQAPVPPTCSYLLREAQRARSTKPLYVFGSNMVRPALPVCLLLPLPHPNYKERHPC